MCDELALAVSLLPLLNLSSSEEISKLSSLKDKHLFIDIPT